MAQFSWNDRALAAVQRMTVNLAMSSMHMVMADREVAISVVTEAIILAENDAIERIALIFDGMSSDHGFTVNPSSAAKLIRALKHVD